MKKVKNILSLLLVIGCMGMTAPLVAQISQGTMTLEITEVLKWPR